ncbi:rhomboid family intramembrane serine protease [Halohasta salina]|uniref:rhomboid family intramembrane serine protease n=1 Tax=Halohasta salina TaxID=2961621 RepID=UPI0020A3A513|nr:rhomboid family intramembrane serine protease [Halohasta salina]
MTPFAGGPTLLAAAVEAALAGLPLQRLLLLAGGLLAVGTLLALSPRPARLVDPLTGRLLYGVPWGTLTVCGLLLAVYYGLQAGLSTPNDPIVLPFRAWSYFDPTGMVVAGFAHAGVGHLTGNLLGTLVFGSLAEFRWGHYTDHQRSGALGRLRSHPVGRALVVFPAAVVLFGVVSTLVALGPVIGFSTTVFAFAGFAIVRYPILTIVAGVGQGVLGRLLEAVRLPQQVAVAEASYSTPWFATIAIQGHMLGFLLGVVAGIGLLRLRDESPPPVIHVWIGVLLFAVSRSLWAIYWFRGGETYVLYRAVGLALVFGLVAIVTYGVVARDRPLFSAVDAASRDRSLGAAIAPASRDWLGEFGSITHRQVGLLAVVVACSVVVGPAIPVNLTTAGDAPLPGDPIEIEGYEVTYGENVPDGQLSVIPAALAGDRGGYNTSGVIVRNTDRHIWSTDTTTGELAADGRSTVRLGGLGWQETVTATRIGWQATGGGMAYQIRLAHDNESRPVFASGPARAEPVVAGHRLAINATDTGFGVDIEPVESTNATDTGGNATDTDGNATDTGDDLSANGTDTTGDGPANETDAGEEIVLENVTSDSVRAVDVPLPAAGESVTVGPIRLLNRDDRLFAIHRGTVVRVARKA